MRRREPRRMRSARPGEGARLCAVAWACLVCALAACHTTRPSTEIRDPWTGCIDATPPSASALDVGIALAVDPAHAPVPRHAAERLVFRQLYDTLVQVDCNGALVGAVAETWDSDDGGRSWTFRLRPDARFWDGTPVTARAVADSWAAADDAPSLTSVTVVGERKLRVTLPVAVDDARVFSQPALAVVRADDGAWPVGTGPYQPAERPAEIIGAAKPLEQLRIVPVEQGTGAPPAIVFHVFDGGDARRALDVGMDVVVSGDATVVEYARALSEYTVVPLPWTRTYVLATHAAPAVSRDVVVPSDDARAMLARDAASLGTRAATPPFGWTAGACEGAAHAPVPGTVPAGARDVPARYALVHPRGDLVARALAQRIVALAWPFQQAPAWLQDALSDGTAPAGAPTTLALDERALRESVQAKRHHAYVVALPRGASVCTVDSGAVDDVARALLGEAGTPALRITPLVDARDYLIRNDSVAALTIGGDGTIRFARPTQ